MSEPSKNKRTYEMASQVGLVLQDFESQLFSTRAELDIAFGPENLGLPRNEIIKRMDAALDSVGMQSVQVPLSRRP